MALTVLTSEEAIQRLSHKTHKQHDAYLAMYSTYVDGLVKDPSLMLVPVDDHIVHRGDGVFEAIKAVNGKAFLLDQHLDRLVSSAEKIFLPLPKTKAEIKEIIMEAARVTGASEVLFRLFISRGPGGFTTNPYESVGSQMYLILTALKSPAAEKYEKGIAIGKSHVPAKDSWLAQIKTCNYLPNVLMKKESVDRNLDFTVGFDAQGFLTESSTENVMFLDQNNILVRPYLRQILRGTTMMRAFDLAQKLIDEKVIAGIAERDLKETELIAAREVMMIGTTLDVLPVTQYEGKPIGNGQVGNVAKRLLELIREDMKTGPYATPF
jgi:branched-chain amino acid aminotransferase